MAYSLTKLSKDEKVCSILDEIDNEKDILISSAKAFYEQSIELINLYDGKNIPKLRQKLQCQKKIINSINEYFKLRCQNDSEKTSSDTNSEQDTQFEVFESYLIDPFPVRLGSKIVMKLSCYESVTDFWLHTSNGAARSAVACLVSDIYENGMLMSNPDPQPGDSVITCTNLGIIRALVLERAAGNRLLLLDVDSGQETYSIDKIYAPDPDSIEAHQQAVHCALSKKDPLFYQNESIIQKKLQSSELIVTFEAELPHKKYSVTIQFNKEEDLNESDVPDVWPEDSISQCEGNQSSSSAEMLQYYKAFEKNKIEPCENSQDPEDMSISDMSIDTSVSSVFKKPSVDIFNTRNGRDVNPKQSVFKEEEFFISKNPIGTQFKANSMLAFNASAIKSTNPVRSTDINPSSKEVRYHKKWRAKNGSSTEEVKTNPDMELYSENWTTDAVHSRSQTPSTLVNEKITYSSAGQPPVLQKSVVDPALQQQYTKCEPADTCNSTIIFTNMSSKYNFKKGHSFPVLISHIESPSKIYANIPNEDYASLQRLQQKMLEVYDHASRPDFSAEFGDLVAVKIKSDDSWIRGQVLHIDTQEDGKDVITVFLIDSGDTITVPENDCSDLLPMFKKPGGLAHCFSLAQVSPVPPLTEWTEEVTENLKILLKSDKDVTLTVVTEGNERTIPSVILSTNQSGKQVTVNDLLVKFCLAISENSVDFQLEQLELVHTELEEESEDLAKCFESFKPMEQDYILNEPFVKNPNTAVLGYNPKDEKGLCYLYMKTGHCNRKFCTKEHKKLNEDGWTTDREIFYFKAIRELRLPEIGTICHFNVTQARGVNRMYGILSHENISTDENPDGCGSIDELVAMINNNSHKLKKMNFENGEALAIGEIVLARANDQDFFYRARILEAINDDNTQNFPVKVVFVDYGTVEWTSSIHIRKIEPKYLNLPFLAVLFIAVDIEERENMIDKATETFTKIMEENEFSAEVIGINLGDNNFWNLLVRNIQVQDTLLTDLMGKLVCQTNFDFSSLPAFSNTYVPG